jgi:hypothetical protein
MPKKFIPHLTLGLLFAAHTAAAQTSSKNTYSFWPTAVSVADPDTTGLAWSWPEYKVLIQQQTEQGVYVPSKFSPTLAKGLSDIFAPAAGAPIKVEYDASTMQWGLHIPGGEARPENEVLVAPFADAFANCLKTLNDAEASLMIQVVYSPASFLDAGRGEAKFTPDYTAAAAKMAANYRSNRCDGGTTEIPNLAKTTSRKHVSALLTGQSDSLGSMNGSLLPLAQLHKELFFSSKGIWVRITLAEIQKHIKERLVKYPSLANTDWTRSDYKTFLDFVLMTRDNSGLTKDQYLFLANGCGIKEVAQIFSEFPLKQCIAQQKVGLLPIQLGNDQGLLFLKGDHS